MWGLERGVGDQMKGQQMEIAQYIWNCSSDMSVSYFDAQDDLCVLLI